MPVISGRYSATSGSSLPPSGTYRSSTLDRSYCTSSYITPRVLTHSRISSTLDSYRYDDPKKTYSSYQKYSKGISDSVDTNRYRRSESRTRDSVNDTSNLRNDAIYNRVMATSAADIINKYSPANYVPKCELIRSRSLSDPRKEKSQVNCKICQSTITPEFNALNVTCNNTKCNRTKTNKTNADHSLSSTNKNNSYNFTNSGTKTKPVYRTIPEPNRTSTKNLSERKNNINKLLKEDPLSNKSKKPIVTKRRNDNKMESCPDIRLWTDNLDSISKYDISNLSKSNNVSKKLTSKTKDVALKFDNTPVKVSTLQHDNSVKKIKSYNKVHNDLDSDNNGNKLGSSVAEIRKKFGSPQSKNYSYAAWTNLGKTKKLVSTKSNSDILNTQGSLKKILKKDEKILKPENTDKTGSLKRGIKKSQDIAKVSESNNLNLNLGLDELNNVNVKQNPDSNSELKHNNNKDIDSKKLHGDLDITKAVIFEKQSKFSSLTNNVKADENFFFKKAFDVKTKDVENKCDNKKKDQLAGTLEKPKHIDLSSSQDLLIKRSPTNHTSDIPSYIPVNKPLSSSIFEEQKIDDIKFIDSELDYSCCDELNSNIDTKSLHNALRKDHVEMNKYDVSTSEVENMNHKSSAQSSLKRIGVDNSVPSTSRRTYQTDQTYISESSRSERLTNIRSTLPVTPNSRSNSAEQDKNIAGLNGLRNIGNTCFMNSVLQCLSNTRLLTEYVKNDSCSGEIGSNGALIKAFSSLISELWAPGSSRVVNTSLLKSQVQKIAPRFMGYAQQDAQEFLRYLLEGLHEDINRVKTRPRGINTEIDDSLSDSQKAAESWARYIRMEDSHIVDLFVGQLKSTLRCTICGHSSVTFDPFWDLSLPIPSRTGQVRLNQCLELFTKEEVLDGDEKPTCSKCQVRRKCTKRFSVQKFPKILVIHLKRFSPTERFRGKLNSLVDFPLNELDLSSYAANQGTPCVYDLYAVSNHSGTTYSGHYTAYCKHPYTHEWHEYNDSRVSSINARNVVSNEAYVLFYELSNLHSSHL
ncbi:MATH and LRR domain-containing protein PFE0570w-like [Ctenocephalides felis]|uniref:MATH and LRR domain-containing protein PFE0570w-like n=1 Tax=Ctenocephalides felis TaxID=7515 RepID=UPI000E6E3D47|nr:MATH and LRR domain-containing protein PFE0570w-like [Ctenocephalides felis]